ncbi:MAG: hydantoinase/oxoprolinase family protein [Candidatus Lokiarchaeota archaeon]|nr:hydantoinase/oxoprolinase family protein [Candidatus Lokiarchaeota archaeon]MBD3339414.1 hydantoinase/oxoprolinase family protein [Candidatus Lokiarchaeota archaeon]
MNNELKHEFLPVAIALDTGGTMTDSFIIDEKGRFSVGKAQTTPENESNGILESISDSLSYHQTTLKRSGNAVEALVYSGTAMLNRLLEREGNNNIGVIVNAGFEDLHRLGRALQGWIYLDYGGRLHAREHHHPEPLIPREQIMGVRGRINFLGAELIPLYKKDVEKATENLLEMGVDCICVCLLFSYVNPRHEKQVARTAKKIINKKGVEVPIYLSSNHNPIRGETPRLNALIIEQYAAEPSRKQLISVARRLKDIGVSAPLRILTSYGGTMSPYHHTLIPSMVSGPIGGMIGTQFIAKQYNIQNLVASDVGGTSFDVGLVMERYVPTKWESSLGRFILNIPMIALDSIGAGTGMYVKFNEISKRLEFGPESAGYKIGVCNEQSDVETVTMTDCSVILGYLNPENFLGGKVRLNKKRALRYIEDQISDPLKTDPYIAARGSLDLIEINMRNHLNGMIQGLGFMPENYTLLSFGGGGPLHVAGYTRDLTFQDILIPEWAAAFSAFGCACADHSYRHEKSVDLIIKPDGSLNPAVATMLNSTWKELKKDISKEFQNEGRDPKEMRFIPAIRMQYLGMLDPLEIESHSENISPGEIIKLTRDYDALFERIFKRGTKSPELGYHIPKVVATGIVPVPKPKLPSGNIIRKNPDEDAKKDSREIYWMGKWHIASIWEMNLLNIGNEIVGPAVLEAPATTLMVPPGYKVTLDKHRIFHMEG